MSMFIVRVELHDATWSDYEALHKAMAALGYARTITGGDGQARKLPTAEYVTTAYATVTEIVERARMAANRVKPRNEVLAIEVANWSGYLTLAA
jgi:hypothetical protein